VVLSGTGRAAIFAGVFVSGLKTVVERADVRLVDIVARLVLSELSRTSAVLAGVFLAVLGGLKTGVKRTGVRLVEIMAGLVAGVLDI